MSKTGIQNFSNWCKKLHQLFSKLQNVSIYHSYTYSQSVFQLGSLLSFSALQTYPSSQKNLKCTEEQACPPSCFSTPTQSPAFSNNLFLSGSALRKPCRDLYFGLFISFEIRTSTILHWFSVLNYHHEWSFHPSIPQNQAEVSHQRCWIKEVLRTQGNKQAWIPCFPLSCMSPVIS